MTPETALLIVNDLRDWLKRGATIKASDVNSPILEEREDGKVEGGLIVEFEAEQDLAAWKREYIKYS